MLSIKLGRMDEGPLPVGTRSPSAHRSWVAGEPVHMERTKIKQSVNFFVEAVRIPPCDCAEARRGGS